MQDIFTSEIYEKKAALRNLRHKSNGRRSNKSMLAIDYMTPKQRKEYIKGGDVKVTNLYDNLLTPEQWKQMDDEKKRTALHHWKHVKKYKSADIKKALGVATDYKLYKEYDRLGIEYEKRKPKKKAPAKKKKQETKPAAQETTKAAEEVAATALQILPARESGTSFFVDDIYSTEEAVKKLQKFAAFLDGEKHKVKVRLEISEVKD